MSTAKIELFDIEFDNPTGVFYSGTTLKGRVILNLVEPLIMRALRLRVTGRAHTSWPDDGWQVGPGGVTERVCCNAEEQYFDDLITLYGHPPGKLGSDSQRQATLAEGLHTFPFRFAIPTTCPTSFEGEYGNVRYVCRAIVDIPWKNDYAAKRAFTIVRSYDLNSPPPPPVDHHHPHPHGSSATTVLGSPAITTAASDLAAAANSSPLANIHPSESVTNESSQSVASGCCCNNGGEIKMRVALQKNGFVPGEHIPIWANVINNCGRTLKKIRAVLLQRARYRSKYRGSIRERTSYRKVVEVCTKEDVPARWALVWDQQYILVPPLPPPIDNCALIKVDYGLVYNASTMTVALPLCIGTIPLRSAFPMLRGQCETDFLDRTTTLDPDRLPVDLMPVPPELEMYDGMPPPCYGMDTFGEISIRERADSEYVRGQLEFAPRYPYYTWPPKEFAFADDDLEKMSVSVFM